MIYLFVTVFSIAPLVILDCIRRKKEERTRLPFSVMEESTAPAATPEEGGSPALKQSTPPLPAQPASDGHTKYTATSTTKNITPEKQTAIGTTDKPPPPRPSYNSFTRRQMEVSPEKKMEPASTGGLWRTAAPARDRRASPQGRTPGATTPGSKKSRKSRKANQPRSASWREYQSKGKKTLGQVSKTDAATLPSKAGATNKSLNTALSEYVFAEKKYQVLGKVDQIIANSNELDVLDKALNTEQSEITAEPDTDRARSPFFDGAFSVWIADRVGSQAEE